ncbi:MAG: hypothetical protein ACRCX2_20835 [Paraclostridium sp.]
MIRLEVRINSEITFVVTEFLKLYNQKWTQKRKENILSFLNSGISKIIVKYQNLYTKTRIIQKFDRILHSLSPTTRMVVGLLSMGTKLPFVGALNKCIIHTNDMSYIYRILEDELNIKIDNNENKMIAGVKISKFVKELFDSFYNCYVLYEEDRAYVEGKINTALIYLLNDTIILEDVYDHISELYSLPAIKGLSSSEIVHIIISSKFKSVDLWELIVERVDVSSTDSFQDAEHKLQELILTVDTIRSEWESKFDLIDIIETIVLNDSCQTKTKYAQFNKTIKSILDLITVAVINLNQGDEENVN